MRRLSFIKGQLRGALKFNLLAGRISGYVAPLESIRTWLTLSAICISAGMTLE